MLLVADLGGKVRVFTGVEAFKDYLAKNSRFDWPSRVFGTDGAEIKTVHRPTLVQRILHVTGRSSPTEFVVEQTGDMYTESLVASITGARLVEPAEYATVLWEVARKLELARVKKALDAHATILTDETNVDLFVDLWPSLSGEFQSSAVQWLLHYLTASYEILVDWGANPFRLGALRAKAAAMLSRLNYTDAAPEMIKMLGSHDDDEMLAICAEALGRWRARHAIEALLDLLSYDCIPRSHGKPVRQAAATALRSIGGVSNEEWQRGYVKALRDGDYNLKVESVEALGRLGDSSAIPILLDLIAKGVSFFSDAEQAINKLGGCSNEELINAYISCIRNRRPGVFERQEGTEAAISRVAEFEDTRVVPVLVEILADDTQNRCHSLIRASAAQALKQLRAVESLPVLEEALRHEPSTMTVYNGYSWDDMKAEEVVDPAFEMIREAVNFLSELRKEKQS